MILRLGLALYVVCCAGLATAQSERTVVVVLPDCADADERRELLELLRLELHADATLELAPADDSERVRERESLWLMQSCSVPGRSHAALRYLDRRARQNTREVSLLGVERSLQPRVIALALAELLRSSVDESPSATAPATRAEEPDRQSVPARAATPDPDPKPEEADQPTPNAPSPEPSRPRTSDVRPTTPRNVWALALGPSFEVALAEGTLSVGATAAVEWQRLSIGVLGALGASSDELGSARYQRLHMFATYALLRAELGAFGFDLGPRAAAGATFASATPTQRATADDTVDATSSLSIELALALRLGESFRARLRADLGYAFGPRFQADGRTLADFSGAYVGASLSAGLAWTSER